MSKIIEIIKNFNVQLALKNIYSKIDEIIKKLNDNEPKYKVYTALLTQTGTSDPVATVLENTLGDIVWSRVGVGHYSGVLLGAFTANKTICPQFPSLRFEGNGTYLPIASDAFNQLGSIIAFCQDDTNFEIQTTDLVALSEWSTILGSSFLIEIRVYN